MPSPTSLPTSGPQRLCVRFRSLQPAASGLASSGCERALFTCHLGRSGMRNAECNALTGKARSQHTLPLSPPHTLTKPLLCVRLDHGRALRDCLAARDGRALHPRPPPPRRGPQRPATALAVSPPHSSKTEHLLLSGSPIARPSSPTVQGTCRRRSLQQTPPAPPSSRWVVWIARTGRRPDGSRQQAEGSTQHAARTPQQTGTQQKDHAVRRARVGSHHALQRR